MKNGTSCTHETLSDPAICVKRPSPLPTILKVWSRTTTTLRSLTRVADNNLRSKRLTVPYNYVILFIKATSRFDSPQFEAIPLGSLGIEEQSCIQFGKSNGISLRCEE